MVVVYVVLGVLFAVVVLSLVISALVQSVKFLFRNRKRDNLNALEKFFYTLVALFVLVVSSGFLVMMVTETCKVITR